MEIEKSKNSSDINLLEEARKVFDIEANAILDLKSKNQNELLQTIQILKLCRGKVIISGMGKSGQVGKKMASTLSSTGTPSLFLHPAESSHGELGVITPQDVLIALSYRGETQEMDNLLNYCMRKGIPIIGMTGNLKSSLAEHSNIVLDISVKEEACPLGLAPTASTIATMALGDAIAILLLLDRGFKAEDFAEFHPGGSLGRRLLTKVKDVMQYEIPIVTENTSVKEVVYIMTSKLGRGIAAVVDTNNTLLGAITDGNIRRGLDKNDNLLKLKAREIMSYEPKTVDINEMAEKAIFILEQHSVQALFVLDKNSKNPKEPVGTIHLHDLLRARLR